MTNPFLTGALKLDDRARPREAARTSQEPRPEPPATTPRCLRCGHPVKGKPWGCKNPVPQLRLHLSAGRLFGLVPSPRSL